MGSAINIKPFEQRRGEGVLHTTPEKEAEEDEIPLLSAAPSNRWVVV